MTSPFLRRVNESLKEAISDEITHLTDPGLGFLTITAVDTASDLRNAVVYYSVFGDPSDVEETEKALERARAHVRSLVGRRVRLKYLPELHFERDRAIEHGMRIEQLLTEIRQQEESE